MEVKCIFFTAPEAKKRRQKEITGVTGSSLDATSTSGQWQQLCTAQGARVCNRCVWSLAEPERPVRHPEEQSVAKFCADIAGHLVTCDRTCSIMIGAL
jgi:hypothetical protein